MDALEQLKKIKNNTVEIINEEELLKKLKHSVASGKPLQVKLGLDPSAPDLHLGHAVVLRKLRELQEMGHQITIILGDFTGRIGDPTGRSETRRQLTEEEVLENARTYQEQLFKVLDPERTEIKFNSWWLGKLNLMEVIRLTSTYTVARMLEREDFTLRYRENQPIGIHEFLYPLLQGYDSVAINADIEFGATEQKFNLLMGRHLQREYSQEPQVALTRPILTGTDGIQKMSKSLGNYIGVAEAPENMFGKVMSIPDSIIMNYFELVTDVPDEELDEFKRLLARIEINPMELKKRLGREIVTWLHNKDAAIEAEAHFARVVQNKEIPDEIEEYSYNLNGEVDLKDLLTSIKMAKSRSDAGRLIDQGAVSIDGQTVAVNTIKIESGSIVKVGKRRFAKINNSDIIK